MADTGFPLPSSSYRELIKIVQGYGRVGVEASLADIAQLTAIGETVVSGNNKFLLAVGIIQGGKKKSITPLGTALANALQHELPEEIIAKWRAVVESNDFMQKVVASVRIRKGMDEVSLESHVAYSAGQPKTPAVSTGARTVIEILKSAALLKEDGGNLIATSPEPLSIPETVQRTLSLSDQIISSRVPPSTGIDLEVGSGTVRVSIEVKVQCTPKDLDELGHKLRKVIRDFNETSATQEKAGPIPPGQPESAEE